MGNIIKKTNSEASLYGVALAIVATLFARGIGFIRELVVAKTFGTSALGDAFIVAFSVPDILVSGFTFAIATLYIPMFHKIDLDTATSKTEKAKFNSSIMFVVLGICTLIILSVEIFTKNIIVLFASGFAENTLLIAEDMLKIMILSALPIGFSSVLKSYGQIVNKYALMTVGGVFINLTVIIALLIFTSNNYNWLSVSVVLGNLIYAFFCAVVIRKDKFSLSRTIDLKNKYLAMLMAGIIPVFISNIISEINQIIDKNFASHLFEGTVSALNYSGKIINLITAVLGTAIASVLLSKFSKISSQGNMKELSHEVIKVNSCMLMILIPIFYFIIVFARPIVSVLFGRGAFDSNSIDITAECLIYYSIGIIGFNLKAVWVRVYNASLDTKTPAVNSAVAVVINVVLNIMFINVLQHKGLALATGLTSVFTALLLVWQYQRINDSFSPNELFYEFIKLFLFSIPILIIFLLLKQFVHVYDFVTLCLIFPFLIVACFVYILILHHFRSIAGVYSFSMIRSLYEKVKFRRDS